MGRALGFPFGALVLAMLVAVSAQSGAAVADIVRDGTVGPAGALTGPNFTIPESDGSLVGNNLFHSFTTFDINTGESATFTATTGGITNVISRVTGSTASTIDGTLRSSVAGADFWFINPNGVMFGVNASLDVPAAFHVSTASEVRFADDSVFRATNGGTGSTLTAAAPESFGFLSANPAAITVSGSLLAVDSGETLSMSAGTLNFEKEGIFGAEVQALTGTISLATVGGSEAVVPGDTSATPSSGGQVNLTEDALLDVRGNGGGTVLIRGGKIVITDSIIAADNLGATDSTASVDIRASGAVEMTGTSEVRNRAILAGDAGSTTIVGEDVTISGDSSTNFRGINAGTAPTASGAGSTVTVTATDLFRMSAGGSVFVGTAGSGASGSISIQAGRMSLSDSGTGFSTSLSGRSFAGSTGNAGSVTVQVTGDASIDDGAALLADTFGAGNGGTIDVDAANLTITGSDSSVSSSVESGSTGTGGTIDIDVTGTMTVDRASVRSSTVEAGDAGTVAVTAGTLAVTGSGGTIVTSTSAAGDAGTVTVQANTLTIEDRAEIGSNTFGAGNAGTVTVNASSIELASGGSIGTDSQGTGTGGQVTVAAGGSISMTGTSSGGSPSGVRSKTDGLGAGGNATVNAPRITISNGAQISASSDGAQVAGDVTVIASDSLRLLGGSIVTEAANADGGRVTIQVGRLIEMIGGAITTTVAGLAGNGGDIDIDPVFQVLNGARIQANAVGGNGGNIGIVSGTLLVSPNSVIEATSTLGVSGTINISSPETDVSGSLAELPETFSDATALLAERCAARAGGASASSLVDIGRGGLPADPSLPLIAGYGFGRSGSPGGGAAGASAPLVTGGGIMLAGLACGG